MRNPGAFRRINNGARNRANVRRQLSSPNRILGDEPEQVGILEEPVERPPDLAAQPFTRRGQSLANELWVVLEQASQCWDVTGIDCRDCLTEQRVETGVDHGCTAILDHSFGLPPPNVRRNDPMADITLEDRNGASFIGRDDGASG
jgi:hypothetical protein